MDTALAESVAMVPDGSYATHDGEAPVPTADRKGRLLSVLSVVGRPFRFLI